MKVLIVDDREEFIPELQEILLGSDMDVDFARTFEEAIALLTIKSYDIVIRSDKKPLI
jgi:DNA-binding response OmpR family regulator